MVTDVKNETEQKFKNIKQNETLNANSCQFTTTTALVSIVPTAVAQSEFLPMLQYI